MLKRLLTTLVIIVIFSLGLIAFQGIHAVINNKMCTVDIPPTFTLSGQEFKDSRSLQVKQYLLDIETGGVATHLTIYDNFLRLRHEDIVINNIMVLCE